MDLTPRQLVDAITRSLKETEKRMAAKYRGVAADRPVPQKAGGRKQVKVAGSQSGRRRKRI
jgi:hypothetical protein